ncbi:MAG TPA: glyoxylate/hydroxypyruvate reductase A [Steroidobacteraceae bacterium]|nr:glyoxylate/hydroxypyruvate reductase A [Steroidobacteraceae bacterium]
MLATQEHDKAAVDIALVANPEPGALMGYPRLRFIQSLWAGVERLLRDPALPRNIPLARLIDPAMAATMVEGTVAAVLYLHRQFPSYLQQQRNAQWRQLPQPPAAQRKVAVLGFGAMGAPVARALTSLGFPVTAWGLHARSGTSCDYAWGPDALATILADTRILINLLPLTAATSGILNAQLFARLPRGAALINLGRGGHLREAELLEALAAGQLGHAVLDVFDEEPLPVGHPFWSHPRITVLPHVAASTDPATAAPIVMRNVAAFRAGAALTGLVDPSRGY